MYISVAESDLNEYTFIIKLMSSVSCFAIQERVRFSYNMHFFLVVPVNHVVSHEQIFVWGCMVEL